MTLPKPDRNEGWIDASWRLPTGSQFPVEVRLAGGQTETREKLEGSWIKVAFWRLAPKKSRKEK